jgi:thymidylate synthase (FAD)
MRVVPISVKLVHATENPERVVEQMGRICYQSSHKVGAACKGTGTDIESTKKFVRMVIARGHESVLEHVSAGFRIVTDRGVTHELVRHRLAAFSQESTRYCDLLDKDIGFIEPPFSADEEGKFCRQAWRRSVADAESYYKELREHGTKPELARSVLPNSLKAEIGMTCNAREWRHILRLRLDKAAHPQMREVMRLVAAELVQWSPVLFEDLEVLR